jgi:hypothetical protein
MEAQMGQLFKFIFFEDLYGVKVQDLLQDPSSFKKSELEEENFAGLLKELMRGEEGSLLD